MQNLYFPRGWQDSNYLVLQGQEKLPFSESHPTGWAS